MSNPNEPKASDTPIRVDSNLTPITQQDVRELQTQQWMEMSVSRLHVELNTLRERHSAMIEMGKPQIAKQIQSGILLLESIIKKKYKDTENDI